MISVAIPHMRSIPGADEALDNCVTSLRGYDELIVVVNEGLGFGPACNIGMRLAHGDYIVIANNDTVLLRGSLEDLVDERMVTKPLIVGQPDDKPRCFYCMPRWIYEYVGGYDERFKIGYFEDDDLIRRWEQADVSFRTIPSVEVLHKDGGGMTVKKVGQSGELSDTAERDNFRANEKRFNLKWSEKEIDHVHFSGSQTPS